MRFIVSGECPWPFCLSISSSMSPDKTWGKSHFTYTYTLKNIVLLNLYNTRIFVVANLARWHQTLLVFIVLGSLVSVSDCPRVTTWELLRGFSWNFTWWCFNKCADTFKFVLKSCSNNARFTRRLHVLLCMEVTLKTREGIPRHWGARHPCLSKGTRPPKLLRVLETFEKVKGHGLTKPPPLTIFAAKMRAFTNWKCRGNERMQAQEMLTSAYVSQALNSYGNVSNNTLSKHNYYLCACNTCTTGNTKEAF